MDILEKIKITKNANGFFDNIIKKFKKSIALFRRNWYYIHVLDSGIAQLVVAHDC